MFRRTSKKQPVNSPIVVADRGDALKLLQGQWFAQPAGQNQSLVEYLADLDFIEHVGLHVGANCIGITWPAKYDTEEFTRVIVDALSAKKHLTRYHEGKLQYTVVEWTGLGGFCLGSSKGFVINPNHTRMLTVDIHLGFTPDLRKYFADFDEFTH